MKLMALLLACFMLASCSTLAPKNRAPAEVPASTCMELAKNLFLSESYKKSLTKVLIEKKLISIKANLMQVQYPRLAWINKVKKSFNQSLRNWNNDRYPAFYIFNNEEVVPTAKRYAENLEKILTDQVSIEDVEATKAQEAVAEWIKSYSNYKTELDQLIEERISLQYNIGLLKKLKLEDNEARDIQIAIKRGGELKSEIITLYKEDKNLDFIIKKLKKEMAELDGSLIRNGKIKDRIVRQAMLSDMLTIVQRELEFSVKNTPAVNGDVLRELDKLSMLIKNSEYEPSTYGIYKIQDKIFIRELLAASKLDVAYNTIKDPLTKLKNVASNYFKNRKAGTDPEKIGIFKRMYAKITSITPKQASIGGGSAALAGIGVHRYFWFKENGKTEMEGGTLENEMGPEDQAHQEQLENTQKVETEKNDSHSHVVEVHIDELTE